MILRIKEKNRKKEILKILISIVYESDLLVPIFDFLISYLIEKNIENENFINNLKNLLEEEILSKEKIKEFCFTEEEKEFILEMSFMCMNFDQTFFDGSKNIKSYFLDFDINPYSFRNKMDQVSSDMNRFDWEYRLFLLNTFVKGYISFFENKKTPEDSYIAMRNLFVITNGRFNDLFTFLFSYFTEIEPYKNVNSIFGTFSSNKIKEIVETIYNEGFYLSETSLPNSLVDEITNFALNTQAITSSDINERDNLKLLYDRKKPIAEKYFFDEQNLIESNFSQKIASDPFMKTIAENYFFSEVKMNSINLWWSSLFLKGKDSNQAAQMYHFDMDRVRFLNFFIYITDVDENTGPHFYVKHSNKRKPFNLLRDGRIKDYEIKNFYDDDEIIEIKGKKGTFFIADTRGFHKGSPPINNDRLIFQMIFSTDLFGQTYKRDFSSINIPSSFLDFLKDNDYSMY